MEWIPLIGLIYSVLRDVVTASYTLFKDSGGFTKKRLVTRRRRSNQRRLR